MSKKISVLFLILISCNSSVNKENKKQDIRNNEKSFREQIQKIILDSKKYRNTEIVILKGNLKNIEKEITPNRVITEIDLQSIKEEYFSLIEIAQKYIKDFHPSACIPIDFIFNYSKGNLKNVLEEREENASKIDNKDLFVFSFVLDTYLALKNQSFIIYFKDYAQVILETIKSFLDTHPKEKVYFSIYNTQEEFVEDFIEVMEDVFEN